MNTKPASVEEYIASFPPETQAILQEIRATIKKAAPDAEETISYGMPAFKWKGPLVYYAAYKTHIGFYPTATGIAAFQKEIAQYKSSKGAVQFPVGQPVPLALIKKMVQFKLKENKSR
jgi:uncharacterized protein YdhG (YjbR/CyaY superfamily)